MMVLADDMLLHDHPPRRVEEDIEIRLDRAYLAVDMVHLADPDTTYSYRSPR